MDIEEQWQLIRSPKYPRELFIKVKGTKSDFIAKVYGNKVSSATVRERAKLIRAIPERQAMSKVIDKLIDEVLNCYPQVKTRKVATEVVVLMLTETLDIESFWEHTIFDIVEEVVGEEVEND